MKIGNALQGITSLLLDSAPVIYYVEKHPLYFPRVAPIFQAIDSSSLTVVVTPVTLAECLVVPYGRRQDQTPRHLDDPAIRFATG